MLKTSKAKSMVYMSLWILRSNLHLSSPEMVEKVEISNSCVYIHSGCKTMYNVKIDNSIVVVVKSKRDLQKVFNSLKKYIQKNEKYLVLPDENAKTN